MTSRQQEHSTDQEEKRTDPSYSVFRLLDDPLDAVETLVQLFERRAKGEPHKVVRRRREEVAPVRWVDVYRKDLV